MARRSLVRLLTKHIGPSFALQEIIYGLVMALATISTISLAMGLGPGSKEVLVLAALGVNITWGLADMLMFIITKHFDRFRHQSMADYIRDDPDGEYPLEAIEDDLEDTIVATLDPADRRRIYLDILDSETRAVGRLPIHTAGQFYGGLSCLLLTVMAAVVVIVPLLLLDPVSLGLRAASVAAVALLFVTGYAWAPFAGIPRWTAGLVMMGAGMVITLSTLVLGG